MVKKELALREPESGLLTKEEFTTQFFKGDSAKNPLEEIADAYAKFPIIIKSLKNFFPYAGAISDILTENKEIRDTARRSETVYQLYEYS